MEQAIEPRAVSVATAAAALGLGVATAWRLIHSGEIRSMRLGGRVLVPVRELDRLVASGKAR